jgi:hypothetical protein
MADRLKDELDTRLESLFRSEPLQDDSFSVRVVSRVRRQMWVRRLSLPFAFAIGAAISAKPLIQLANALPNLLGSMPAVGLSLDKLPISSLLQTSTIIMGVMLLAAALMVGRMLED